jgi:hypothetical protein
MLMAFSPDSPVRQFANVAFQAQGGRYATVLLHPYSPTQSSWLGDEASKRRVNEMRVLTASW